MAKVVQFPFSRMSPSLVQHLAKRAADRSIECMTVDGDICLTIDDVELWFSAEQFACLLDQWSETLLDAGARIVRDDDRDEN